jgi:protein-L-isoaspartate(D-aspartate) O-methyltransferase
MRRRQALEIKALVTSAFESISRDPQPACAWDSGDSQPTSSGGCDERFTEARERMVERQIRRRGVRDPNVLSAMQRVPRDAFVPTGLHEFAYDDTPLPLEGGQSISQPVIVAKMLEAAELHPGDHVLDVGTGSGYSAAIAAEIAARVESIERHPALAETARERLRQLGYANVAVHLGDGTAGLADHAPFCGVRLRAASRNDA